MFLGCPSVPKRKDCPDEARTECIFNEDCKAANTICCFNGCEMKCVQSTGKRTKAYMYAKLRNNQGIKCEAIFKVFLVFVFI